MGSHNVCTGWMYWYYFFYLAWWWLNEPKHVAEFLILVTNVCCLIDWISYDIIWCQLGMRSAEFLMLWFYPGRIKNLLVFFVSSQNCNEMVVELCFKFTVSPNKVIHNGMWQFLGKVSDLYFSLHWKIFTRIRHHCSCVSVSAFFVILLYCKNFL